MAAGCAAILCALLAFAYNPEQDRVNGAAVPTHWENNAVTWNLDPTLGKNVSTTGGPSVQALLTAAFSSWQNAQLTLNGAATTVDQLTITLGQVSSTLPANADAADCLNVIGFTDSVKSDFPTGTIAFTQISTVTPPPGPPTPYTCTAPPTARTCTLNSCLADADIEFNPAQNFSTASPPPTNDFSVQSIATHEIGHMLGLDHSGLANAVMYPFGDTGLTTQSNLSTDDAAGIAFLYPVKNFSSITGALSGTVTQGGAGIFEAHVLAIDAGTGDVVADGITAPDGTYSIAGLPPASYNVLVLPLAGVYDHTNFNGWECGYNINCAPVPGPVNYTGTFH
ncbi:MAG TPA: matrixin family metalloprotease [Terriglobia bacterium]|nr:matrixin family metalloprotease [Terriglobia bacterium]